MTECSVDDCTSPVKARGLCGKHYERVRRTGDLVQFHPPHIGAAGRTTYEGGVAVSKQCTACERQMPIGAFTVKRSAADGLSYECSLCATERGERIYKAKTPEQIAELRRRQSRATRRRVLPGGQAAFKRFLTDRVRKQLPVDEVWPWARMLADREGLQPSGVDAKRLYTVLNRKIQTVDIGTVERIALALGGEAEEWLRQVDVPHGFDGWAPITGHRHCRRCGTCWHPHHGDGLCASCFKARAVEKATGVAVVTHRERMMDNLAKFGRFTARRTPYVHPKRVGSESTAGPSSPRSAR